MAADGAGPKPGYDTPPMAIQAPTASPRGRVTLARIAIGSSRRQTITALVVYCALSLAYFGIPAVAHLGRDCVCGKGNDPGTYMWFLSWWPHAVLHGTNPFFTDALYAPQRLDLGPLALVPGAALVAAPVTLLFGPLVSYNLLVLASPILAALFAFLLCRYITHSFPAALVGGYLFGFSAYMLGHMLGHLNLVLTFPIPAGVHLVLRLIDGRIRKWPFIVLLALDITALISFSTELALTFVLLGALTLVLALALAPDSRARIVAATPPTLAAALLAAIVTSPVIYYSLKGNIATAFVGAGDKWGGDLLGFVIPTRLIAIGGSSFTAISSRFNENDLSESGIYLGIPLLLIVARYAFTRWRLPASRVSLSVAAIVVVLLLGSHLHVDGHSTIPLPWDVLGGLPVLKQVLPVRLGLYLFLIFALIAAMWIARPRAGAWSIAKWELMAITIALFLPNLGSGLWRSQPSNPRFFTTTEYRRYLHRDETVLALPYPGFIGYGMLWQANTGMWFRLAGANLGKLVPADYQRSSIFPALTHPATVSDAPNLESFLIRQRVGAVIVDASDTQQWPAVLTKLGLKAVHVGGVLFYRLPSVSQNSDARQTASL